MKLNPYLCFAVALYALLVLIQGCTIEGKYGCNDFDGNKRAECERRYEYNTDECQDSATLLATTAGSPDNYTCPNKHHKMRVESVTKAGEEIGATVFCECVR